MDNQGRGRVVLDVRVILADKKEDEAADRWQQGPGENRVQVLLAPRGTRSTHWSRLAGGRGRDLRHGNPPVKAGLCAPIMGRWPAKRHSFKRSSAACPAAESSLIVSRTRSPIRVRTRRAPPTPTS